MVRKKTKSVKFFPFSAGIPWKFENSYLIPEIDKYIWDTLIKEKDIIVTAFGGPLESFFSLSYFELLASLGIKAQWLGYSQYNFFVHAQKLATISNISVNSDIVKKYPVPLFFDQNNNAYFNCLNNYIISRKWYKPNSQSLFKKNKEPLLKQIFNNSLFGWDNYIPKIRLKNTDKYNTWKKINNFNDRKKTIVIFPDNLGSMHSFCGLKWNEHNIKEFAALLYGLGIQVAVCSNSVFYGTSIKAFKYDAEIMLGLLKDSWIVLSRDLDFHLIGMMISDCISVSLINEKYDLFNEMEFLNLDNMIYTYNELSPLEVKNIIGISC